MSRPLEHLEAEAILRDLAAVFVARRLHGSRRSRSGRPAHAQRRGQVPDTGRAGARGGLHGVPRSRHRRGLREPSHRGGHGVLPGGVAGGSGPLVRPHPSGRPASLERRGRGDVPDRAARSGRPTGCSPATATSSGSSAKRRWCGGRTGVPGSSTASASTSPSSSRRRRRSPASAICSRRCSIPSARWWWC